MSITPSTMPNNKDFAEKAAQGMAQAVEQVNAGAKKPTSSDREQVEINNLRSFVNSHKLAMSKEGKVYLKVEAWQYIAKMKNITPSFESAMEIMNGITSEGKDQRYLMVTTACSLRDKDGNEISRATMVATNLEPFLQDKQMFAVYGMSQTRALSRAMRNVYGYLAVAAGFQATPWEEIV